MPLPTAPQTPFQPTRPDLMVSEDTDVLIIGGSVAGVHCAMALREAGYTGQVMLVEAEATEPYDKPPLSKGFLDPERSTSRLTTASTLHELGIDYRSARRARALDVWERTVIVDDGEVRFGILVIATGCEAQTLTLPSGALLPDATLPSGHIRTAESAASVRGAIWSERVLAVIGGGFLGLEVAATARNAGAEVHVVEKGQRLLERGLSEEAAVEVQRLHRAHGVHVRLSTALTTAEPVVNGVRLTLSDGNEIACDFILVATGAKPCTRWLQSSGLELADGVVCDAGLQAAPGIFAIGDCARWHNPRYGRVMRMEHWTSAVEQARFVAKRIAGRSSTACSVLPYVWSDQFSACIQTVGLRGTRVEPSQEGTGSVFREFDDDELVGATTIGAQAKMLQLRRYLVAS